jgi:hypothetical protein
MATQEEIIRYYNNFGNNNLEWESVNYNKKKKKVNFSIEETSSQYSNSSGNSILVNQNSNSSVSSDCRTPVNRSTSVSPIQKTNNKLIKNNRAKSVNKKQTNNNHIPVKNQHWERLSLKKEKQELISSQNFGPINPSQNFGPINPSQNFEPINPNQYFGPINPEEEVEEKEETIEGDIISTNTTFNRSFIPGLPSSEELTEYANFLLMWRCSLLMNTINQQKKTFMLNSINIIKNRRFY